MRRTLIICLTILLIGVVYYYADNRIVKEEERDCSGFISAAYQFGTKYGTATLSQVFKNTTWANLKKGDIGNKSGVHTWMFLWYNTNSGGEKISITTYEATTDGSEDRAKLWDRTWADAQTYVPMTKK